jgi:hypothetical protein
MLIRVIGGVIAAQMEKHKEYQRRLNGVMWLFKVAISIADLAYSRRVFQIAKD